MTCAAALEAMMDAEPSELAGQATTSLATHLTTCRQCRAVAHRLSMDTHLLAAAVASVETAQRTRRTRTLRVHRSLVPVGLVAALLLVLASRSRDATLGIQSSPPTVADRESVAPPLVVTDAVPAPVQRPTLKPVRAFPAPIPVAAVRINAPPPAFAPTWVEDGPGVVVDVPTGERVAVIRTSNPKITVVWLY